MDGGETKGLGCRRGLGGVGAGWQFQRRGRVGACSKRGKSSEGLASLAVPQEGARALVTCSRRGLPRAVWGSGTGGGRW